MVLKVYTDGSCHNLCKFGGVGAWAYVIVDPDNSDGLLTFDSGFLMKASSNKMEMEAVYQACKVILKAYEDLEDRGATILIHCDSAYVVNCFLDKWYVQWELREYIGVSNSDLWKRLINKVREVRKYGLKIEFIKVKGHSGNRFNELADDLAGEERRNEIERIQKGTNFKYKAYERATKLLASEELDIG